jgi:hypothetical protein
VQGRDRPMTVHALEKLARDRPDQWSARVNDRGARASDGRALCRRCGTRRSAQETTDASRTKRPAPIPSGEVLQANLPEPLGLTQYRLARSLRVPAAAQRVMDVGH